MNRAPRQPLYGISSEWQRQICGLTLLAHPGPALKPELYSLGQIEDHELCRSLMRLTCGLHLRSRLN